MAIDTTPSTVATNALDALDFSSLIGGPMEAIIKAQALAARTTYEFINEVGLTTDPDTGEKKPINVSFQYNKEGKLTTLSVPLITIITIPNIEVTSFVIDFIANISASSSSTEETTSDSELGVDVEAEAGLQVGPFAIKVKAKANYSSKQHSKAAKESKYSVEYTMNVNVQGGQGDMPAGLQTVLNILQGSNTSVGPDEMVAFRPKFIDMDGTTKSTLDVVIKDAQGYLASGTTVTVTLDSNSPFKEVNLLKGHEPEDVLKGIYFLSNSDYSKKRKEKMQKNTKTMINHRVLKPYKRRFLSGTSTSVNLVKTKKGKEEKDTSKEEVSRVSFGVSGNNIEKTGVTDTSGNVIFQFVLKDTITEDVQGNIVLTTQIPVSKKEGEGSTKPEVVSIPFTVLAPSDGSGSLKLSALPNSVDLSGKNSEKVTATILNLEDNPVGGEEISFEIFKDDGSTPDTGAFDSIDENITSDASGNAEFIVKKGTAPVPGAYKLIVSNNSSSGDVEIPITV